MNILLGILFTVITLVPRHYIFPVVVGKGTNRYQLINPLKVDVEFCLYCGEEYDAVLITVKAKKELEIAINPPNPTGNSYCTLGSYAELAK